MMRGRSGKRILLRPEDLRKIDEEGDRRGRCGSGDRVWRRSGPDFLESFGRAGQFLDVDRASAAEKACSAWASAGITTLAEQPERPRLPSRSSVVAGRPQDVVGGDAALLAGQLVATARSAYALAGCPARTSACSTGSRCRGGNW